MSTHHTLYLAILASAVGLTANASSHSDMESSTDYPSQALFGDSHVHTGWVDDKGEPHEQVFDVVWSGERQIGDDGKLPAVGNTVNMETAEYSNSIGAAELMGYFTDPSFDPEHSAFYYVRVLEIPTPRWTLYDKVRFNETMPDEVPLVHQERAFSSPVWYTPEG
ncbi:DUF3604 domain-containing protein [Marinobacter sp. F4216]|uniref:DUF3604 domain-containing protein n=1 Tax=Marinobacter sp. F4216 TaxID=2874281 RepID=UPI001CBF4160|nr:DUF3604 domain-containing protein [Marinobacter sp. F4216]